MLLGATAGFVGVAVASVFQCVAARSGFLDGVIAALVAFFVLSLGARAWAGRQPVAFRFTSGGLTTWNRAGTAQYGQITGCAQWSDCLLALTLLSADGHEARVLIAADAVERDVFRELSVRARRGAHAVL
ncbi:lipoprotein [Caballeronia arationis]|jgi:hypothetical protein|uniref:Lipoprotein n=2 Tax=Caballeronia arationis TaxID=1777142 RepID=A0A7Z7N3N7_9BURK|nr:hypothetical protein [Caballeronia arationis]SAK55665.1 lipoprotein [Caballeronia arationis]SOE81071.1 hypothetical protein SAMN05446927_4327 [Caballeronia arationis]